MHLVAIGGSDAGISAALRARELDSEAEVTVVVADAYPNFSICGIPYYVSGEVPHWRNLAHRTIADLQATGMQLRLDTLARRIEAADHKLLITDAAGSDQLIAYDKLLVGTGAVPVRPPRGAAPSRGGGCGPGAGAEPAGGSGHPRRPGVAAAMDDQVNGEAGRRAGIGGACGVCRYRRAAAERGWLQPAGQRQDGRRPPASDRDGQFRLINEQVRAFQAAGEPVISVDTKKKELVGNYKNGGKEWHPRGEPERVEVHDFKGELGRAVPYGVYDMTANAGWVNVGTDADTGAFAVESIRRWWQKVGKAAYAHATRLLITADAGGSNGSRLRLRKVELARLAHELGLEISVSHFPPGTSKWNRIEHRLFAQISMNWRGRPLTSHEVIVETIAATTTKTGLTVQAALDTGTYEKGIKISDKEMKALEQRSIRRHDFHGEWNYALLPASQPTHPTHPTSGK